MACWVKLALAVMRTEWPNFEVLAAFTCLRVPMSQTGLELSVKENIKFKEDVKKLAHCFKVDAEDLMNQIVDLKRYAQKSVEGQAYP